VPVTVTVKPLPPDSGESHTGAVGKFTIRSFTQDKEVHKNDVIDLYVQVAGKGNFPMISSPVIQWPEQVEAFEANAAENYNKFISPLSGSKLFTIPFTPKSEGALSIPAVTFRYFDPEKGDYATVASNPVELNVLPARKPALTTVREEKPASAWRYILSGFGIIVVAVGIYLLLKRGAPHPIAGKAQVIKPMEKEETKTEPEKDVLESIRSAFEKGDSKLFYKQLNLVIDQCMMNKYQVDGRYNWELALAQKGVDAETIREIRELKKEAELAMYTPFVMEAKMVDDLARIERIVC
jgi:hypothetical protein